MQRSTVIVLCSVSLVVGMVIGFGAGVLSVKGARSWLAEAMESESAAEVASPVTIDRPGFRFSHPSNWKIDTADEDYDPDRMFTVESPGSSFAMLIVYDGEISASQALSTQVDAYKQKLLQQAREEPFKGWGTFTGEGMKLSGRLLGLNQGFVRIFAWRALHRTFTVVELAFDEDLAMVKPGLELIERTFKVNELPQQQVLEWEAH